MNVYKKLGALTVVIVLAMSFCVMAGAVTETLGDGLNGSTLGVVGNATGSDAAALVKSVKIAKSLKASNPDSLVVAAPAISYSYTITGVNESDGGSTITDSQTPSASTKTKTPPNTMPSLTGTAANTIAWTNNDRLNTSAEGTIEEGTGTVNTKYLTVNFDESGLTFEAAGVYRYAITETIADTAYTAAGVTDGTEGASESSRTETLYLDVYVRDPVGNENGMQIYGYVLATADTDQPQGTGSENKIDRFTTDVYKTNNIKVSMSLVGDSANNSHPFPFNYAIANTTVPAFEIITDYFDNDAAGEEAAKHTAGTVTVTSNAGTKFQALANGDWIEFVGLPVGTGITTYEMNNVTGTTYNSTAIGTSADDVLATGKSIRWIVASDNETTNSYIAYSVKDYNSNSAVKTTTAGDSATLEENFTNTLLLVSPTGVVLRYAPYLLTMGAGIVALPLTKSYRKREDF